MTFFKLLRVDQYIKNFLIFFPLFFSLKFTETDLFLAVLHAFVFFSMTASAVYIMNDLRDIDDDRTHPEKKKRPIAAGAVSTFLAKVVLAVLLIVAFTGALLTHKMLFFIILTYFIMNILYTFKLKQIALLDIFIISTGFLLRLFAGTSYAGIGNIEPSHWIIIMTFLLSLFLGIAKRRDDVLLMEKGEKARKSVKGYNRQFIDISMAIMSAVVIVSYILYTVSPQVAAHFQTKHIYLTVVFVMLGIFRYLQITFVFEKSGNPTKVLLTDRFLQLVIAGWITLFIILGYRGIA